MKKLKQWCEENKEYQVLEMYQNAQNERKSNEIGFSSSKIVNWKCKTCGTSWKQSLNSMTRRTVMECPYCMHTKPSYFYNLATQFPILETEWNYEKNNKKPEQYLPCSSEKVWWKCKNGHAWQSIISDRTSAAERNTKAGKPICPFCNHKRPSSNYNLITEFPDIARQWNYNKNGILSPTEVTPKSSKVVW